MSALYPQHQGQLCCAWHVILSPFGEVGLVAIGWQGVGGEKLPLETIGLLVVSTVCLDWYVEYKIICLWTYSSGS